MKLKNPLDYFRSWYYYFKFKYKIAEYDHTQLVTRNITFERDANGSWFAVLPEWEGPRAALLMVAGADTLLELLSEGKDRITLHVTNDHEVSDVWRRRQTLYTCKATSDSGNYFVDIVNMDIWLCGVCVFVFSGYPTFIYFAIKED